MAEFCLPILGFGDEGSGSYTVTWKDGSVVYRGILGDIEELMARAREQSEKEAQEQQLRDRDVIVLDDHRKIK
jgi:hypothetical protein